MLKRLIVFVIASFEFFAKGQSDITESLKNALVAAKDDETKLHCLQNLFFNYIWSYSDSAAPYAQKGFLLAKKLNNKHCLAVAYFQIGMLNGYTGTYMEGLEACLEGIKIEGKSPEYADSTTCSDLGNLYLTMSSLYREIGDYENSIAYLNRAELVFNSYESVVRKKMVDTPVGNFINFWLYRSHLYEKLNFLDSALKYVKLVDAANTKIGDNPWWPVIPLTYGNIYLKMGNYKEAIKYYHSSILLTAREYTDKDRTDDFMGLAKIYKMVGQLDSGIFYANKVLNETKSNYFPRQKIVALGLLADIYKRKNKGDSVAKFLGQAALIKDSLFGEEKVLKIQKLTIAEHVRQIELADQLRRYRENLLLYSTIAALLVFLAIAFLLKEKQLAGIRQKTANLKQQTTDLEMQALRAQMNPHFIFNSLNSINRFILQNNRLQASEYLTKFSRLVRLILQNSQSSFITLESELESISLYLELESLRFDYYFSYKISIPPEMDISELKIPPLILQPYVENAIWHGLMPKKEKGQLDIDISEENASLYISICDNGIGRKKAGELASKSATRHKSMGIRLTAERILLLHNSYGGEPKVTINDLVYDDGGVAGTEVIIKIPVIYD